MKTAKLPIRAILVDPYTQTVGEIDFVADLKNYYSIIGCQTIAAFATDEATVWHDDEYLVSPRPSLGFWQMPGWAYPVGGRCILTAPRPDQHGNELPASEVLLKFVQLRVQWLSEEAAGRWAANF